ncbi:13740_t:CDS:2, partial [Acaulospora colombiana]
TNVSDENLLSLGKHEQLLGKSSGFSSTEGIMNGEPFQKFRSLFRLAPCFLLNGEQIQPLKEPGEFYNQLKVHILSAKERIFLAALYIGSNEKDLVETIRTAVKRSKQLKVHLLLDCLRSTRADHDASESPANLLAMLVKEFPDQPVTEFEEHDKPYELVLPQFPDPVTESHLFRKCAASAMKEFIGKWTNNHEFQVIQRQKNSEERKNEQNNSLDTIIFPVVQMGPFAIRQDESATLYVLDAITKYGNQRDNDGEQVFFASGYFNFTQKFKDKILNAATKLSVLAASPEANGFFRSKGMSKHLPQAYTLIEKQFYYDILKHGKSHLVTIEEYKRPNWTFHAKGLWYYMSAQQWPSLTIIGSSNYGYRSTERDLEAQAILITTNEVLRKAIHEELQHLRENTVTITSETFQQVDRKVPFLVRIATKFIKTML